MRRRIPLILACLGILIVFAVLTHYISQTVIQNGVNDIEMRDTANDMHQLRNYLRMTEQRMHQHILDWACWDEAYDFMDNHNSAFILNNFDQSLLDELHIAGAAFYDLSGKLITFVDSAGQSRGSSWAYEEQYVYRQLAEIVLRNDMDSMEGFVTVHGDGMVIAAHKIYDGNKFKPPKGLLIMSRLMDSSFVDDAQEITTLRFSMEPVTTFSSVPTATIPGAYYKLQQSDDVIHAYSVMFDVFGHAAFTLHMQRNRDLAETGRLLSKKNFWLILGLGCFILLTGLGLLLHVERRFIQREMEYREGHDSLTRLPNKLLFPKRLREILETAQRDNSCVGVLFLDLDRFKGVNDSYGHSQGDAVLCETAKRLRTTLATGLIARSGGDDFLLAIPAANRQRIFQQGQGILAVMNKPFTVRGNALHLGASMGLAFFPDDGIDTESLMQKAELAMYNAKESGGNTITFYTDSMGAAASRKMALETALYTAVDNDALTVYYQPKINIATHDVSGCEALIRWKTSDGTWVPPPAFIPLAEEIGLVTRIDMFVLRTACRQVLTWQRDGSGTVPVAVNMSGRSILSDDFADHVIHILKEENTPPSLIDLEITETSLMTDLETASKAITRLHDAGLRIALDDFGTGYSSMQYLYSMPIACMKIDKRFIDGITVTDGNSRSLVKGMLALASNLGMDTVAEGVEDLDQLSFLAANHCNIIQGYLFSKPLSSADCGDFLRNRTTRINAVTSTAVLQ